MNDLINTKNSNEVKKETITLTVVVQDEQSQPTEGARVSIKPADASGVTNSVGEIQFKLGTATKYNVTASYGSKTVTVPYYVTPHGATRLVVNPTYVRAIEKQLQQASLLKSSIFPAIGIILGLVIIFFVTKKFLKRRKKTQ